MIILLCVNVTLDYVADVHVSIIMSHIYAQKPPQMYQHTRPRDLFVKLITRAS